MPHPALSAEDTEKLIAALEGLGQEADADALAAARAAQEVVAEAGVSWRELLEVDDGDDLPSYGAGDDDDDVAADTEDDAGVAAVPRGESGDDQARIDRLIGSGKLSDDTVEDLMAMKEDLAEGEFREMDRRYLLKLEERVLGARKKGKR